MLLHKKANFYFPKDKNMWRQSHCHHILFFYINDVHNITPKKLFDDVFTEIEKLQKKNYNIDTNQFIWDMKDYFDVKNKSTHE